MKITNLIAFGNMIYWMDTQNRQGKWASTDSDCLLEGTEADIWGSWKQGSTCESSSGKHKFLPQGRRILFTQDIEPKKRKSHICLAKQPRS